MTKTELFYKKQAEMSNEELIALAEKEVGELAKTYGKSHKMTIPPMITDTDMVLTELIRRFKEANLTKTRLLDEWNKGYNRGCDDTQQAIMGQSQNA